MKGVCSVCSRPDAAEIDQRLAAGESERGMSRLYGIEKSSMNRHARTHLRKSLQAAAARRAEAPGDDLLDRIGSLTEETIRILRRALKSEDLELALKAIARAERQAELVAKLTGRIRDGSSTVNVVNVTIDAETAQRMAETYLERHAATPALLTAAQDEPEGKE